MRVLRQIDPEGVARRKGRKLKRRTYKCKVVYYVVCVLSVPNAVFIGS